MNNKIIVSTVLVAVVIILTATVLMPVLKDAQDGLYEETKYSNISGENQIHLSPVNAETSNTLNVTATNIVTDKGTIEYWSDTTYSNVVLLTDSIYVLVTGAGAISVITASGTTTPTTSFTAVVSAGEITYSIDGADSVTKTYKAGYVADPNGSHVSCPTSQTRYFDSQNFAQCRADGGAFYAYIDGVAYKDSADFTMNVNSSVVADTDDQVSTLTSINYTTSKTLNSTCVMENDAEYRYTTSPALVDLLGAIAPIVIIAIVVAAIGVFLVRRE